MVNMVNMIDTNEPYTYVDAAEQWYNDAKYVIGIMARRNAYFTDWDISDIVGPPPDGYNVDVYFLLVQAARDKLIKRAGHKDTLSDGTTRDIWIGVK